jgi:immune inhibitor A
VSPSYDAKQYLILENRKRSGFDFSLPGEGLLVWRVDEHGEMEAPDQPGMLLIQADGKHDLEKPKDWNEGDAGDPFPGQTRRKILKDSGSISTSFQRGKRSGVTLENIALDQASGNITLDVKFAAGNAVSGRKRKAGRRSRRLGAKRKKAPVRRK